MGVGAEIFSTLAILEARDQASAIYDKVQAKIGQFSEAMKAAADSADESGAKIDDSLLKTASSSDALTLATAKVEAAQARAKAATEAQAESERALLSAQEQTRAAADDDTAAMDRQIAAADKLAASQKETAKATKTLRDAEADQTAITKAQAPAVDEVAAKTESAGSKLGSVAATMGKVGLGVVVAGGLMAKGAADFQSSTTVLQTSGGETAAQMDTVRKGILSLSSSTGTALKPLTDGMYMIGSAGDTGAAGLAVLKSAAQGAKAENADLGTVSNALTTVLGDYHGKITDVNTAQTLANQTMDQMIAVVSSGKTTTEALAGSLSTVLPVAAAAHLGFDQVGGAMATMTGQGVSAQQSAQDLANTIRSLQSPNAVAVKEMQQMGLNSTALAKNLGTTGLAGTIKQMTDAVQQHMGPAGTVVVNAFQSSSAAAQNAQTMISKMPGSLQTLAKSYLAGSVSAKQWKVDLQGLDPVSAHLMTQFAGVANQTHQFNTMLTAGQPAQVTAAQALTKMMGGATGLNTALMLSTDNYKTVTANTKAVADAAKGAGQNVDGWKEIQSNFNQKLSEAKQSVEATSISIGTALLPSITSLVQTVLSIIQPIMSWVEGHQKLTVIIIGAVAGIGLLVGAINLAVKAYKAVSGAIDAVGKVIAKVTDLFSGAGDAQDAAAVSADGAAGSMDGLAISEEAATTATEEQTIAADENAAGWIRSSLAAVGAAAKFLIVQGAQLAVTIATKAWTAAQWLFNAAMDANPIVLVVIAIAALAAGVVYAYTHFQAFRDVVEAVWDWLKSAVTDVIGFVQDHWQMIVEIVTGPIVLVATLVEQHWDQIKEIFTRAVGDIINFLTFWFVGLPLKFAGWLASAAAAVGRGVADLLIWWVELPGKITSAIFGFFSGLAYDFEGWVGDAESAVANKGTDILNWFKALPGEVLNSVSNFGSLLFHAGEELVYGLIQGVENMASSAVQSVENLGGSMLHGISHILGISSPSRVMADQVGKFIPAGIAQGITENVGLLQKALTGAATLSVTTAQTSLSQSTMSQLPVLPATGGGIGGGGGTVVNINNDFSGAHIMGNSDMDQLAQKVSAAVARILPTGGLRIAM